MPNIDGMSAVSNTVKESFIMVTTSRASSSRHHISMMKKRKGRNNIMASKPN